MVFNSKKDKLYLVVFMLIFVLNTTAILPLFSINNYPIYILIVLIILFFGTNLFLLSIWFYTSYKIYDANLFCRAGIINKTINIQNIKKITTNTTIWSGVKFALSRKGILIQYNKWDEIYISPLNEELFINELKKVNANIEIIQSK